MELEILNYQVIGVKLNKRKNMKVKSFDLSSSKPIKISFEIKEEAISGKSGKPIVRADGDYKEVISMINTGKITFSPKIFFNPETHKNIETLLEQFELWQYGMKVKHMDNHMLLKHGLVEV